VLREQRIRSLDQARNIPFTVRVRAATVSGAVYVIDNLVRTRRSGGEAVDWLGTVAFIWDRRDVVEVACLTAG
jgi:hypothetical protein